MRHGLNRKPRARGPLFPSPSIADRRRSIYYRIARLERPTHHLLALFDPLARHAGRTVAETVAKEARGIFREAIAAGAFTALELAEIRCRCDLAGLALVPMQPGSPLAVARAETAMVLDVLRLALAFGAAELLQYEWWARSPGE